MSSDNLLTEINEIVEQHKQGNITNEERDHLLTEIRDVRAAQECADNETLVRNIVAACNVAMALV